MSLSFYEINIAIIRLMEKDGLLPVPIFINGVEAHTVVRDLLTTSHEQGRRAKGIVDTPTLSPDCTEVGQRHGRLLPVCHVLVGQCMSHGVMAQPVWRCQERGSGGALRPFRDCDTTPHKRWTALLGHCRSPDG